MTVARLSQKVADLRHTPGLLIAQKVLRHVPFRPIDVGKLCFLRYEGIPRVDPRLLRGAASVRQATEKDIDALVQLRDIREEFLERFAAGDHCVVAESGGRIVGYEWFSDQPSHFDTAWGYEIQVPDGFVYAYDAFLDPSHRNTGIWLRFKAYLGDLMQATGRIGVLTFIDEGNAPSLRTHLRFGFTPETDVFVLRVLGASIARELPRRQAA